MKVDETLGILDSFILAVMYGHLHQEKVACEALFTCEEPWIQVSASSSYISPVFTGKIVYM